MKFMRKRASIAGVAAVITIGFLAGCSANTESSVEAEGSVEGLTAVVMGETPGLPAAFSQFGADKGFFEDEGIDLEVKNMQNGSIMANALLAEEIQFSGGDVVSFTKFRAQGVPVVIARPGSGAGTENGNDYQAIVANDTVTVPEDLEGKTIAVNELNGVGQIFTQMSLERNYGVDTSTITWAEIGLPDTNAAIDSGQVAAGYSLEPFQTIANNEGLKTVLTPGVEYGENSQIGLVLTSEKYLEANPETVEAFQRAHLATRNYIEQNPDEYRAALVKYAGLDEAAAGSIRLPAYHENVNRETLTTVMQDLLELGLIERELDADEYYAPGA